MGPFLDTEHVNAHKRRNVMQSAILLGGIGVVLAIATYMVWGLVGPVLTVVGLAAVYTFAPTVPPETMMRLYRARLVQPGDNSQLSSLVDVLAFRAELPKRPALYVVPSMTLNAFAAGTPDRAAIAITEGLLRRLTLREIAGVLAHEMSHIRNNDLHVMGFADLVTRLLQLLSYLALALTVLNLLFALQHEQLVSWWTVLLLYLAPALSSLLQLALSRTREFDADLEAVGLTGDPLGLASALRRLENYTGPGLGGPDVSRARPPRAPTLPVAQPPDQRGAHFAASGRRRPQEARPHRHRRTADDFHGRRRPDRDAPPLPVARTLVLKA